jgi:chemotaxis protein CheX
MEKKYVLIADDEPDVRAVLKELVMEHCKNVFVIEAIDGSDAIRKVKLQKFHLAMIDLRMPKLDGDMVLSGIKSLPFECKPERTLVISGVSSAEEIRAKFGDTVDFLAKPVSPEHLQKYLRMALGQGETVPEAPGRGFDIGIVNAFIDATIQVLETMAQTPAVKESLYLRAPDSVSGDISAILSITSSKTKGSLAISFEKGCFLNVVNRMMGESYDVINADNSDAAAELCNQIFGVAKKAINASGNDLQPAIPSIVTGEHHKIQHKTLGPCVVVKFRTPAGWFTIETVMEAVKSQSQTAA